METHPVESKSNKSPKHSLGLIKRSSLLPVSSWCCAIKRLWVWDSFFLQKERVLAEFSESNLNVTWNIFEFSLNDFCWIHWIKTKSKFSMVTFPSLALVRYLLPFTSANSYLTRCSWENLIFATTSGNISVISCGVSLVTIPVLD